MLPTDDRDSVVVLGGGLAGIAAACHLVERGYPVTLIEAQSSLGGRASSFTDPESGLSVDNGQHVFLRRCTSFIDLLTRLDTLRFARIQPRLHIKVAHPAGRVAVLRAAPLPAPLHVVPSFLTYSHLTAGEKLMAVYAMLCLRFADHMATEADRISFFDWLKRRRQSDGAINSFWDLIVLAALNEKSKNVSASMGLMLFKESLLKGRHEADMGYLITGLSEAIGVPARRYLERRGARLLLGVGASRLVIEDNRVAGLSLDSGDTVRAGWYISALPYHVLLKLLPEAVAGSAFFSRARSLRSSPIVNLHLWFNGQVMDDEMVAFVGSPLQWVFNRTRMKGDDDSHGQYLTVSLSGASEYLERSDAELRDMFLPEILRVFPKAREVSLARSLVTREERATLRPLPGTAGLRPSTVTPIERLLLAGDWTDTGWPSTMEGAVISGNKAAEAVTRGGRV